MNTNAPRNLENLECGQAASIQAMSVGAELHARLSALGLRPGRLVEVIRRAALGGPLQVRAGTTEVMLRRREAARILVTPEPALDS